MPPKIHKRLHDVPGRPVILNCGYYTENISSFLDYYLQPLAQKMKSYIKDTKHFLSKLKNLGKLPQGAILCTIDIVGLYSNIPHSEVLNSLRRFLELKNNKQISSDSLIELSEIVLKNNFFEFDQKTFKQVHKTAIRTKFAPPYAILSIAYLEEKTLNAFEEKPMIWWRYIDNIFFIWEHGEESLEKFLNKLNTFHPTIKFSNNECSKETINFLDVNVRLVEGELMTDLFVKPTDTHQFLDPSSSHPYHCKKGIPYSQALRLNRISSDNESFDKRCNDLGWLMERGYNGKMIKKQILRACEHSRKDLLEREKAKTSEPRLTFNITYYPVFQNIRNILQELQLLSLTPDKEHKKVFPDVAVVGFRNGKRLKDYLVRAALPKTNETRRCEPCEKKTCFVCNSIRITTTFTTETCGEVFKI